MSALRALTAPRQHSGAIFSRAGCFISPGAERLGCASRRGLWPKVIAIWAVITLVTLMVSISSLGRITETMGADDLMRIIQVRDLLGGQSWYDISQHRSDMPGGGAPMHWSRLVDIPLATGILILTPLLGQANAELVTMALVPIIALLLATSLTARLSLRLAGPSAAVFSALVIATAMPVLIQLRPFRIDHHGWQIVLALIAVNGMTARDPRRGGYIIGAALALWLSISIEGLPLAALICAVMALRWLRSRDDRLWFVATMQSLTITSLIAFSVTRGWQDLAQYCDAISPIHLTIFAFGAVGAAALSRANPLSLYALLAGFGAIGGGALAIMLLGAPQCAGGGFAELDPLVAKYWHANVLEGMPIWEQSQLLSLLPSYIIQSVVLPIIGLGSCWVLIQRTRGGRRDMWIDYLIVLGGAFAVSLLVNRASSVSAALAAVPVGWLLSQLAARMRRANSSATRIGMVVAMAIVLFPALPLSIVDTFSSDEASAQEAPSTWPDCKIGSLAPRLGGPARGEVFTGLNNGPMLLYHNPELSVVATGHHRGAAGMKKVIAAFIGKPEQAREIIRERGSKYVAICPNVSESTLYIEAAPNGFMAQLVAGNAPSWLEPIPPAGQQAKGAADDGGKAEILLWRVRD